jgi:hypothetical protein
MKRTIEGGVGSTPLEGQARLRPSASCLWRSFADEVLLLGPDSQVRALSGTAAAVWSLLEDVATRQELVDRLATAYGTSPEVIEADVAGLLGELTRLGFVEEEADG